MTNSSVNQLLLARIDRPRLPSDEFSASFELTRRQFLAFSASAALLAKNAFAAESPQVWQGGSSIYVAYRNAQSEFARVTYGEAARLGFAATKSGYLISIRDACLPGTGFEFDLTAVLEQRGGIWMIELASAALAFEGSAPLDAWLRGAVPVASSAGVGTFRVGGVAIECPPDATLEVWSPFQLVVDAQREAITAANCVGCSSQRVSLVVVERPPADSFRRALLSHESGPSTLVELQGRPEHGSAVDIGQCRDGSRLTFVPEGDLRLHVEAYRTGHADRGIVVMEGAGTMCIGPEHGVPAVRFERTALAYTTAPGPERVALAARVARRAHMFDAAGTQVSISGFDEEPLVLHSKNGFVQDSRTRVALHEIWLPVADADSAKATFAAHPVDLVLGGRSGDAAHGTLHADASPVSPEARLMKVAVATPKQATTPPQARDLIVLGDGGYLLSGAGEATFRFSRGVDLLNLSFTFDGFDVLVDCGRAYLLRRRLAGGQDYVDSTITVHFPPQHIAETWFNAQDPHTCTNVPCVPDVTQARMSGPSQIVFSIPKAEKGWARTPLTIAALTEWSDLALQVDRRALRADATFEEQMAAVQIDKDTTLKQAMANIRASLQPPAANSTQLELAGRLILSPSSEARWITPVRLDANTAPLWHARLNDVGRKSVRAIWSRYMMPGTFQSCGDDADVARQECTSSGPGSLSASPKLLTLTKEHHWSLVGQTSVYGLPALRRIVDDPTDEVEQALKKLPRSRVVRATTRDGKEYRMVREIDSRYKYTQKDGGIALPEPFADADIMLTSIGAIVAADWHGEPPLLRPPDEKDTPQGFSLERFGYRLNLGREIRVEAVSKGYLLPLGVRASFIELWERLFFRHPKFGTPYAYLVKREFIVIQKPIKRLPGVNQPYDSRDFPAERIVMLTKVTPDLFRLADPGDQALAVLKNGVEVRGGGRLTFPFQKSHQTTKNIKIFWPRVAAGLPGAPGDVDFKWTLDEDSTAITSNLLFVENSAVALQDLMKEIVEFYRSLDEDSYKPLRRARMAGTRRRYAPTENAGDTTFDTDNWVLSARGIVAKDASGADTEAFFMDGRMEGGDQPPCYPVMQAAEVNIQSLDRLLGRPQGLVTVAFNPAYVKSGFAVPANRSEIYLNLLGPDIQLDVTGQGTTTGGVAQPNALAVALSRKIGIVGGQRRTKAQAVLAQQLAASVKLPVAYHAVDSIPAPQIALAGSSAPESPYAFDSAQSQGKFDPSEFLGGLTKAKLLGIVPLQDVLKSVDIDFAPKLVEKIGFGPLGKLDEALPRLKALFNAGNPSIRRRLTANLEVVDKAIDLPLLTVDGKKIFFADIYPRLNARYRAFRAAFDAAMKSLDTAKNFAEITEETSQLVITGRPLVAELERTLRDPVPPLLKDLVAQFGASWIQLKDLINGKFLEFGRELVRQVVDNAIFAVCRKIHDSQLGEVLLGSTDVTCEQIIANPVDALQQIDNALFEEFVATPLRRAIDTLRAYERQVTAKIAFAERKFSSAVLAAIVQSAEQLRARLQPAAPDDPDNILASAAQLRLRDRLMAAMTQALAPVLQGEANASSLNDVREALKRAKDRLPQALEDARKGMNAAIEAEKSAFKAKVSGDLEDIVADFKKSVVRPLVDMLNGDVATRIVALDAELVGLLEQTRAKAIERIGDVAAELLRAVSTTSLYAQIAKAGRVAQSWCDATAADVANARAIAFADDVASGLLGDLRTISDLLTKMLQRADDLQSPSPDIAAKFDAAKRAIKTNIQEVATVAQAMSDARAELAAIRAKVAGKCDEPLKFLRQAQQLIQLRQRAVTNLQEIVVHVIEIEDLLAGKNRFLRIEALRAGRPAPVRVASATDPEAVLADLVRMTAQLAQSLTAVAKAGVAAVWSNVATLVADINDPAKAQFQSLRAIAGFGQTLQALLSAFATAAKDLRDRLNVQDLKAVVLQAALADVSVFVQQYEKRFAAYLLQSITVAATDANDIASSATRGIANFAGLLAQLHAATQAALNSLYKALTTDLVGQVIAIVLPQAELDDLKNGIDAIEIDRQLLLKIREASDDPQGAFDLTQTLLARWYPAELPGQPKPLPRGPALISTLSRLAQLTESLFRADLGHFINAFKQQLNEIMQDARDSLAQLLPTRVDLNYDWKTPLGQFPRSPDEYVFKMIGAESADDLSISAHVSVDFLTGARSASITGTLKPFEIWLVTKTIDIARIQFKEAKFQSLDGSSPKFNPQIETVILGKAVEFIQPLQAWLSPSEGGLYVKPLFSPVGLEVGYTYDAGIILVGALQFINVSLGAAAQLPFDGSDAVFKFHFASAERPFLISSPPYGGGGHVELFANATSIKGFSLSCRFGAVVAIKFGPLSAQGRVTAGIYFALIDNTREIAAFVEAVGEGNIACFSICVFIQVGLRQRSGTGGTRLEGFARYSFTFKVGFVKISIGFTANYTIHGNRGAGGPPLQVMTAAEALSPPCPPLFCFRPANADDLPRYATLAPRKTSEWHAYRSRVALDLLG